MNGESLRSEVFWVRRGRPSWAVPVLLFLAVVLVAALAFNLANLDTGGEAIPDVPDAGGTSPSSGGVIAPSALDEVLLLGLAGTLAVGAAVLAFRKRERTHREARPRTLWETIASLIGFAIVIAFLVLWPRVVQTVRGATGEPDPAGVGSGGNPWPTAAGAPLGLFLAVSVFAAILVLVYVLRRGVAAFAGRFDDAADPGLERLTAAKAVRAAIADLEIGGDVRAVVLACYQRFCDLLGSRGIADQLTLTPRELEALAIERLQVSRPASETLTSLFEEARYSEHPLGAADRARAIESLARIRAALEG